MFIHCLKVILKLKEGAISLPLHPSSPTKCFQLKTIERENDWPPSFLLSSAVSLNIRQLLAGLTPPKAHAGEITSTVCSSCLCQCEEGFERHEGAAFCGSVTL